MEFTFKRVLRGSSDSGNHTDSYRGRLLSPWLSILGAVVAGGLAVMLWREAAKEGDDGWLTRFTVSTFAGALVGLLLVAACYCDRLSSVLDQPPICQVMGAIHYPAFLLGQLWGHLRLPPHGDQGFIMMFVFLAVQWLLVGMLVGIALEVRHAARKRRQKRSAYPPSP